MIRLTGRVKSGPETDLIATPEEHYLKIAEPQLGLVTFDQLKQCGLTKAGISRRVRGGRLERICPGVYRVSGSPRSHSQRLMAHLLHAGTAAALSHRSAARQWGWDPFRDSSQIEITVDRDLRNAGPARYYKGLLSPRDVGVLGHMRVTSPVRTVLDLAAVASEEDLEIALDCGLVRTGLEIHRIVQALAERGRQGRRGSGTLRRLLALRADGHALGSSPLEIRFIRFLREKSLPQPISQYPVSLEGRNFVLDFAYPNRRLAIETDGYRWHASRERFESDRDKGNGLSLAGWRLLRVTNKHMANRSKLIDQLRRALGQEVLV